jgi:hypothetical protein
MTPFCPSIRPEVGKQHYAPAPVLKWPYQKRWRSIDVLGSHCVINVECSTLCDWRLGGFPPSSAHCVCCSPLKDWSGFTGCRDSRPHGGVAIASWLFSAYQLSWVCFHSCGHPLLCQIRVGAAIMPCIGALLWWALFSRQPYSDCHCSCLVRLRSRGAYPKRHSG